MLQSQATTSSARDALSKQLLQPEAILPSVLPFIRCTATHSPTTNHSLFVANHSNARTTRHTYNAHPPLTTHYCDPLASTTAALTSTALAL